MTCRLVFTACVVIVSACAPDKPVAVAGDDGMVMSAVELQSAIDDAHAGDLGAANALAVHYANVGNIPESHRWLLFAGERGDCNALGVLYDEYVPSDDLGAQRTTRLIELAARFSCRPLDQ